MPKNSKVGKMYDAMVREGMDKGKAARIAQSKTGTSLATGRKAKGKKGKGDAKMKAKQRRGLASTRSMTRLTPPTRRPARPSR